MSNGPGVEKTRETSASPNAPTGKAPSDAEGHDASRWQQVLGELQSLRRVTGKLTVAVVFMALAVLLLAAAVFGDLINYMAGDVMVFGGVSAGAAILGFVFGVFAGRKS